MKLITTALLAGVLFLTACGKEEEKKDGEASTEPAKPYAQDVMTEEMLAEVPKFLIVRVEKDTGVVSTAVTNLNIPEYDKLSPEEQKAYGEKTAQAFAQAKPVTVLEGDESKMENSSQSFFFRRPFGFGYGFGYGFGGYLNPFFAYAPGIGFNYGYLGGMPCGGYNFYNYGLATGFGFGAPGILYPFYRPGGYFWGW